MNKTFFLLALASLCSVILAQDQDFIDSFSQGVLQDDGTILVGSEIEVPINIGMNLNDPGDLLALNNFRGGNFNSEVDIRARVRLSYEEEEFNFLLTETIFVTAQNGEYSFVNLNDDLIRFDVQVDQ